MPFRLYHYFGPVYQPGKQRILQTVLYCLIYVSIGIGMAVLGPTLVQLANNNHTTVAAMGGMITSRGLGRMVGSLLFGVLYDWYPAHLLLALGLVVVSICMVAMPFLSWITLSYAIMFIFAIGMAGLEVGTNTLLIWVWKEKVGPLMQLLHFFFGVGACLSPLVLAIMYHFEENSYHATNATFTFFSGFNLLIATVCFFIPTPEFQEIPDPSSSSSPQEFQEIPDGLEAGISDENDKEVIVEDLQAVDPPPLPSSTNSSSIDPSPSPPPIQNPLLSHCTTSHPKFRYYLVVICIGLYLLLYVGVEQGYASWLPTIGEIHYGIPKKEVSFLAAAFWFLLMGSRLVIFPISFFVNEITLLVVFSVFSGVALIPLLMVENVNVFWGCSLLFSFAMGPIFGSAFSLPSYLGFTLSAKASSGIIIAVGIGDMAFPIFLGIILSLGKNYMILGIIVLWTIASCIFVFLVWIIPCFLGKYHIPNKSHTKFSCLEDTGCVKGDMEKQTPNQENVPLEDFSG